MAVIAADLDFFKRINDAHGHAMGDRVLKDFCARTTAMLRITDVMARFGGEEFVVLLPGTDKAGAQHMAERLRGEIETQRDSTLPTCTVSLGVAVWEGSAQPLLDIQALINRADAALYNAKAGGRNRVSMAD